MEIPGKDPAATKREYMKQYMRQYRAAKKLGKAGGLKSGSETVAQSKKTVTTKRTRTELSSPLAELPDPDQINAICYQLSFEALLKVQDAIRRVKPDELDTLGIKRLTDVSLRLREVSRGAIETQITEEEQCVLTDRVFESDEAIENIHSVMRISARPEIDSLSAGQRISAPDSGGLCDGDESEGVAPV